MNKKQKKMLTRIIVAAVMLVLLNIIPIPNEFPFSILKLALYLVAYLKEGFQGNIKRKGF
jgi:Cd2+/Zn2+-exporting ATPase